jgi:hypothetical protein
VKLFLELEIRAQGVIGTGIFLRRHADKRRSGSVRSPKIHQRKREEKAEDTKLFSIQKRRSSHTPQSEAWRGPCQETHREFCSQAINRFCTDAAESSSIGGWSFPEI